MKQERLSAGPGGIEPPTIGLEGRAGIQQLRALTPDDIDRLTKEHEHG